MSTIRVLPPETSRLIAAGEVIDRPQAVLRELLDNAIDSGATEISVDIEGGGIGLIRVADNGSGMSREDLELSILPHATSKIRVADDLLSCRTLGFRGEALASIAAAAGLEITSRDASSPGASRLAVGPGRQAAVEGVAGKQGTRVEVTRLFENYPARRQFLKRAQAEASLCRQTFEEKAAAHPDLAMRLTSDGRLALALLPARPEERVAALWNGVPADLVHRVRFSGEGFEGSVVLASPSYYRTDRRLIETYVNRRRVSDPGLSQVLDAGFQGFLPGGAHPAAFLFAEVDPAIADFNIHPAKREVRFKDFQALRSAIYHAVQAFLLELSRRRPASAAGEAWAAVGLPIDGSGTGAGDDSRSRAAEGSGYGGAQRDLSGRAAASPFGLQPSSGWDDFASIRERSSGFAATPRGPAAGIPEPSGSGRPRYVGRALGLFLVAEWRDAIYLIDQHAAHERHLFDAFMAKPPVSQELLVPAVFEAEDEAEDKRLADAQGTLCGLGFGLERTGGSWMVTALPSPLDRDPVGALREVLALAAGKPTGHDAAEGAAAGPAPGTAPAAPFVRGDARAAALATAACRAAVKDGDTLDDAAAADLARIALALPEPRCPHGRPVWVRITRDELFSLVRRKV